MTASTHALRDPPFHPQRRRPPSSESPTASAKAVGAIQERNEQKVHRKTAPSPKETQPSYSRCLAEYDGRRRIGTIVEERPRRFRALDAEGDLIGFYASVGAAANSISHAYQMDDGAAALRAEGAPR